jgi:plastocyanin
MKELTASAIIMSVVFLLGFLVYLIQGTTLNVSVSNELEKNSTSSPQKISVIIKNHTFYPSNLTIRLGDTVEWKNLDNMQYNIISSSGELSSKVITIGQNYSHTFLKPGEYFYHTSFDPEMNGLIRVK